MLLTRPIPVNAPQRSPEWHGARLGIVTGSMVEVTYLNISDIAKNAAIREIMQVKMLTAKVKQSEDYQRLLSMEGTDLLKLANMAIPETEKRAKYRRDKVGERLTGVPADPDVFASYEMKWGTVNEPVAIAKYERFTGISVKEAPLFLHQTIDTETGEVENLACGASPDGLIEDNTREPGKEKGVIECKCLRTGNHLENIIKFGKVPKKYIPQIQMEMWITGRSFCDFIGFDSRINKDKKGQIDKTLYTLQFFTKRVERDDEYINEVLEPSVRQFLQEVDKEERFYRMKARQLYEQGFNFYKG